MKPVYIMSSNTLGQRTKLDMIADNVANANTSGYKKQTIDFAEILSHQQGGNIAGAFTHHRGTRTDYSTGGLSRTENKFDVAINGDGFFAINRGGNILFTRNGEFTLDNEGNMVTHNGDLVLDNNFAPINIPPESTDLTITGDGNIANQNGVLGNIGMFNFENMQDLRRAGDSAWQADPATAFPSITARALQGFVEGSNVNAIEESVNMTEMLRKYQSTMKLIGQMEDLEQRAIRQLPTMP